MLRSLMKPATWRAWSAALDRRLGWLPVDWRLLAPFFALGFAAGSAAVIALLVYAASYGA